MHDRMRRQRHLPAPSRCCPLPSPAKRLYGVELALLHACCLAALHYGHTLAGVDLVGPNGVAVQVADGLHLRTGAQQEVGSTLLHRCVCMVCACAMRIMLNKFLPCSLDCLICMTCTQSLVDVSKRAQCKQSSVLSPVTVLYIIV